MSTLFSFGLSHPRSTYPQGLAPWLWPKTGYELPSFMCECKGTGFVRKRNPKTNRMRRVTCECGTVISKR